MIKVELMKKKENKLPIKIMQVKTKVVKHKNSELEVLPRTFTMMKESIKHMKNVPFYKTS